MLLTTTSKINAIKEYMKEGDYDSAVQIAEKVNPEKVSSVRDLMTMANAFLKKRRYEDAKEVYVEMHNHASTHKVLVGLIELCLKTNAPEEAETYIREFRKQEPDNPERLIYRYRVDAMLGKGPEYLVKSLSKLKEEDYSDVWGLELAKAYFKMEDYRKCAQECKDVLLWFAGTESAAKAHVLLGACAEKGVTVKMPEVKPAAEEEFDDEEAPDVPVIAAPVSEAEPEPETETVPEAKDDDTFFDLSAAIGETVSEAIAEDREKALSEEGFEAEPVKAEEPAGDEGFFEEETEPEETEAAESEETEEITEEEPEEETAEAAEPAEEDLEAVEDIIFPTAEESVPEDATETIRFETEDAEPVEEEPEVDDTFFEEDAEEPASEESADEPVYEEVPEEPEAVSDDSFGELDIIALAIEKARTQEDDDDDVVIRDYFPQEEKRKSRSSWDNEDAVPTLVTLPSSYRKEEPAAEPESDEFFEEPEEVPMPETEEIETEPEEAETAEPENGFDAFEEIKLDEEESESLYADNEEEDGQISFFADLNDDDVKLAAEPAEEAFGEEFTKISGDIADAVKDEMENGRPEADDVSKAPTKVHTDLAAQALDAVLREDDEAIEKALLGLLSDK